MPIVYKILPAPLWQEAQRAGVFRGAPVDLADGYIPALKWEPSRGGALFPHLYAPLVLAHVKRADPLPLDGNGRHVFPDLS
jgi:uncharacterized protein (DUF952 family)